MSVAAWLGTWSEPLHSNAVYLRPQRQLLPPLLYLQEDRGGVQSL